MYRRLTVVSKPVLNLLKSILGGFGFLPVLRAREKIMTSNRFYFYYYFFESQGDLSVGLLTK